MKIINYCFGLLLLFPGLTALGQEISIMSYNIRYDNPKDGENCWEKRKAAMTDLIRNYHPDIFGIQEGLAHQVEYIDSSLTQFSYFGVGRDNGKSAGEFCAIFYDKTNFKLINSATFWLSKESETVSVGWDAAMERICTYGLLQHKTSGQKIWVFNTHFDHLGQKARRKSAYLILKKMKAINTGNLPLILMGDLNAYPESKPIKIIKKKMGDAFIATPIPPHGPVGTFSGFNPDSPLEKRIDYIFVNKLKVLSFAHINDRRDDQFFISDHLPVFMKIKLSKNQ